MDLRALTVTAINAIDSSSLREDLRRTAPALFRSEVDMVAAHFGASATGDLAVAAVAAAVTLDEISELRCAGSRDSLSGSSILLAPADT